MTEGTVQIPVGRRRIIKRPRLTRLLDDANARLILLIAPAGYGKTTLSRQWLAEGRRNMRGTRPPPRRPTCPRSPSASRGCSRRSSRARPNGCGSACSPSRPRRRSRSSSPRSWPTAPQRGPTRPGSSSTTITTSAPQPPRSASSRASHRLREFRLLLTSRTHPAWASAKRTTYGEVVVGTPELALTPTESAAVLGVKQDDSLATLLEATQGWPVVTGLAAVTSGSVVPDAPTAEALYDFLADEVFNTASPETQTLLCRLAFVSTPTLDVVRRLADGRARRPAAGRSRAPRPARARPDRATFAPATARLSQGPFRRVPAQRPRGITRHPHSITYKLSAPGTTYSNW